MFTIMCSVIPLYLLYFYAKIGHIVNGFGWMQTLICATLSALFGIYVAHCILVFISILYFLNSKCLIVLKPKN